MNRLLIVLMLLLVAAAPLAAQTGGLNLPADLYVLLNDGLVQRYERGGTGIETLTPADVYVIDFGLDADAEQIAYRTQSGLVITALGDMDGGAVVDARADVPPLRGRGQTVAWSPNGGAIAYTTQTGARIYFTRLGVSVSITQPKLLNLSWSPDSLYLALEAENNIWWIYRLEDTIPVLRAALPSSFGTTWISNGVLAFVPADGGLTTMDLNDSNRQTPLLSTTSQFRLPTLAPDGRLILFRHTPDSDVPDGYGQLAALTPGDPQLQVIGQTPIDLRGNLRWSPGASLMIAFEGGILALFDPATGQGFPLPINNAVTYTWGPYEPAPVAITPEATASVTG